jgi:hypothetical protein
LDDIEASNAPSSPCTHSIVDGDWIEVVSVLDYLNSVQILSCVGLVTTWREGNVLLNDFSVDKVEEIDDCWVRVVVCILMVFLEFEERREMRDDEMMR